MVARYGFAVIHTVMPMNPTRKAKLDDLAQFKVCDDVGSIGRHTYRFMSGCLSCRSLFDNFSEPFKAKSISSNVRLETALAKSCPTNQR